LENPEPEKTNPSLLRSPKFWLPVSILLLCLIIDQTIKIYVKTHYWPGQMVPLLGNWFNMYFIENNGMAFGLELGGRFGKFLLTGFRIAVSIFGFWYLWQNIRKSAPTGLLVSIAFILAGAIGNIIDSVFYGVLFKHRNFDYEGGWFEGRVVDMFYAPIIESRFPQWFPFWGGEEFTFFSPIWNFADACITIGVAIIIIGQHRFFTQDNKKESAGLPTDASTITEEETP
jgi:signal peptidase II